ncbi:MAG: hypothetical protein RJB60_2415, partial [Pseudomonadota bacterium]
MPLPAPAATTKAAVPRRLRWLF